MAFWDTFSREIFFATYIYICSTFIDKEYGRSQVYCGAICSGSLVTNATLPSSSRFKSMAQDVGKEQGHEYASLGMKIMRRIIWISNKIEQLSKVYERRVMRYKIHKFESTVAKGQYRSEMFSDYCKDLIDKF